MRRVFFQSMRRTLLRLLGVAVCTWVEFVVFPGHTYLQAGTQLSVPMLERLVNPGYLSRDLVATHENLQYTAYDETTLFLHQAGLNIETALLVQQIASRAAGVLGILLLALATGMTETLALVIAACVNLGANLAGPNVSLVEPESIPYALAWGPILLAIGLLAREKPLLAGLAAGVALIYEPAMAAPFCLILIVAFIVDRRLRHLLRPATTIFAVFILLLANLAQLQPGIVDQQSIFTKIAPPYAAIEQFRTPHHWVSLWSAGELWSYLAIWICGIWAVFRVWRFLNRQSRWLLLSLPACGIVSIPLSYILLDRLKWSFIPSIQPTRWLMFTLGLSAIACWMAALHAVRERKIWESAAWLFVPCTLPFRAEVLDVLRLSSIEDLQRLSLAVLLACVSAVLLVYVRNRTSRAVALIIPLLAIALLRVPVLAKGADPSQKAINDLAEWVKRNTWGSSMFLFPDLGRSNDPGLFRARSERALWVDWNGGSLVPLSESFAMTWWERWHETMQPGYSAHALQTDLSLPIDYYVLQPANRLPGIKPVFANQEFLVYDANDMRNSPEPLRSSDAR